MVDNYSDLVGILSTIRFYIVNLKKYMNRQSIQERAKILGLLVEGNSLRATTRITGFSINTISKLVVDVGISCARFHDQNIRGLNVRRLQCDEIWCFVGAKAKNVTPEKKAEDGVMFGYGSESMRIPNCVGGRDAVWAAEIALLAN